MTEIQGKSILVRVSARFELARVRVIGSQLYCTLYEARNGIIDLQVYCWSHPSSSLYEVRFFKSGIKQKPVIKTCC